MGQHQVANRLSVSVRAVGLLGSLLMAVFALAQPGDEVMGRWSSGGSMIEISRSADNLLQAHVIALRNPVYMEGEDFGPPGSTRLDGMNPDKNLVDRPVLGINLLSDYRFDGKKWQGKIYDPESGKSYSSNMKLSKKGVLKMRGYIGVPMFGRTAEFVPVSACDKNILYMLELAGLDGCAAARSATHDQAVR